MTWYDPSDKVQPGDVFVKRWGSKQLVHVMLPPTPSSAKQPYMVLDSGNTESTHNKHRSTYGNTTTKVRWHYVGTIPEPYLSHLVEHKTLVMEQETKRLDIYYEGGTYNRFWLAPAGLSLGEAKKQRVGTLYRTRWPAMKAFAEQDG